MENDRSLEFSFAIITPGLFPAERTATPIQRIGNPFHNSVYRLVVKPTNRANEFLVKFTEDELGPGLFIDWAISDRRTLVKPVFSIGGWSQLSFSKAFKSLDLNLGYGQEEVQESWISSLVTSRPRRDSEPVAGPNFIWSIRPKCHGIG